MGYSGDKLRFQSGQLYLFGRAPYGHKSTEEQNRHHNRQNQDIDISPQVVLPVHRARIFLENADLPGWEILIESQNKR